MGTAPRPSETELDALGRELCELFPEQHPMELDSRESFDLITRYARFDPDAPVDGDLLEDLRTAWYAQFCAHRC